MNCRSCGAPLSPGARACPRCGMPAAGRPTGAEVRARIQGGGRHAARSRSAGFAASPATVLLTAASGLLWALQLVYLFVDTLSINMNYGEFNLGSQSFSVIAGLRVGESSFLGVLLVLLCLAGLASLVLPKLFLGRRMPAISGCLAVLTLALFFIALGKINSAFDRLYFGNKPAMGLIAWLFILNCVLLTGLAFLAAREREPIPARAASPRRSAARTAPAPAPRRALAATKPVSTRPVSTRPAPSHRNVTPPDAETIAALRRMAQMHKQGLVSDAEFARIKAECVARGWIRE